VSKHYAWKDLERRTARRFGGKRLWRARDFSESIPDVETLTDVYDTKYTQGTFGSITLFKEAQKKYKDYVGDRRFCLVLHDSRPGDYVLLKAEDYASLLRERGCDGPLRHGRYTYAIDWDGTCVEEIWPGMGDWLPGAAEALQQLSSEASVCIYSLRLSPYELDGITLRPHGASQFEYNRIREKLNSAGLEAIDIYPPWRGKPAADYLIDDRAGFDGDWRRFL
jgi:hypothetical protein